MSNLMAVSALAVLSVLILMKLNAGRPCRESRSVLLRVPVEVAWERIRDFGALQASHGRGRPLLRVETSELRRGDGLTPGTVWRQIGRWGNDPWWSEIEVTAVEPLRRLEVTLARDVFGTPKGLAYHRCIIDLEPEGDRATKLSFRLRARTRGAKVTLARTLSPERLHARLLDVGLRSLKVEIDGQARAEAEAGTAMALPVTGTSLAGGIPAASFAAAAMSAVAMPAGAIPAGVSRAGVSMVHDRV